MYGKVYDTIYDGTLYGHWEAIVTMQQLIVLATPDGIIDMTPQAIAARTSIPFDIITKGLKILSEPDPYSRTPGDEGRRITLIDDHRPWGWRLVNHAKYMRLRDMEAKREADRVRIAEKRKNNKDVATVSQSVANVAHSDLDLDLDSHSDLKKQNKAKPTTQLPDWLPIAQWEAYTEMRQKIKKPMSEYAKRLAIAKLADLQERGSNPAAVLGQSIFNSWQGLFEIKKETGR